MSKRKPRQDRRRICRCEAYGFPHKHDIRRCVTGNEGDDYTEDHRLDSPQRGQAKELNALRRIPQ